MSQLQAVRFDGVYRRKNVMVRFTRTDAGDWALKMIIEGVEGSKEITIPKRERIKPCWTVACDYLAMEIKAKPSRPRVKIEPLRIRLAEADNA